MGAVGLIQRLTGGALAELPVIVLRERKDLQRGVRVVRPREQREDLAFHDPVHVLVRQAQLVRYALAVVKREILRMRVKIRVRGAELRGERVTEPRDIVHGAAELRGDAAVGTAVEPVHQRILDIPGRVPIRIGILEERRIIDFDFIRQQHRGLLRGHTALGGIDLTSAVTLQKSVRRVDIPPRARARQRHAVFNGAQRVAAVRLARHIDSCGGTDVQTEAPADRRRDDDRQLQPEDAGEPLPQPARGGDLVFVRVLIDRDHGVRGQRRGIRRRGEREADERRKQ